MKGRLLPRTALTSRDEEAMLALLGGTFEGVSREHFREDLDAKNWVILLRDERGALHGFSTLHWETVAWQGRSLSVVYSGDTVVDPAATDAAALSRSWIGAVNRLRRARPQDPVWWLLICSGFRTYRFLPLYWRRFHPRYDEATPPGAQALMQALARQRFGPRYDTGSGVVHLAHPQVLRPAFTGIPASRAADPHVAFFTERNPGHARGDELVCLCELSADNLTPAGERMWRAGETALLDEHAPEAREARA
jgi:hypothetical protein